MSRGDIKLIIDRCVAYDMPAAANLIEDLAEQLAASQAREEAYRAEVAKLWEALENCRLLAARHRKEEWASHILRFCSTVGVNANPLREEERTNMHTQAMADALDHMEKQNVLLRTDLKTAIDYLEQTATCNSDRAISSALRKTLDATEGEN